MAAKQNPGAKRRFLVEVRGILEVEAESGDAANRAVETWIQQVSQSEASASPLPEVRVRWLRIFPETDELPGYPTE